MLERAKGSDALWADPVSNCTAISAIFIKPGIVPRESNLRRLQGLLESSRLPTEKAALNYLLGETFYWGGLTDVLNTRDKSCLAKMGDDVAGAYLAAWDTICCESRTGAVVELRHTIVKRYCQVLGTKLCGGNLSPKIKQQVVARFIDQLDAAELSPACWRLADRAQVYRNLGIDQRLTNALSASMPSDFDGLWQALQTAWSLRDTNSTLRFVTALESHYGAELDKRAHARRELFRIYETCEDARAFACISACAKVDSAAWLDVYRYAVRQDPVFPLELRKDYVRRYLSSGSATNGFELRFYDKLIAALIEGRDYDLAITNADSALAMFKRPLNDVQGARILRRKAIALAKIGAPDAALSTIMEADEVVQRLGSENLKTVFANDVRRISSDLYDKGDE
jgi:hypothetical protein